MTARAHVLRFVVSGGVAGVLSTVFFATLHHLLISDIWFSLVPMAIAGALCGACLGGTFGLLVSLPTRRGWFHYNLAFTLPFVLLGALSVLVFEPITTAAALIAANEAPTELINRALPMTGIFTVIMAAVLSARYGRRPAQFASILVTSAALMAVLGVNVSIIGLVSVPMDTLPLIGKLFALILALAGVFAVTFALIERNRLA